MEKIFEILFKQFVPWVINKMTQTTCIFFKHRKEKKSKLLKIKWQKGGGGTYRMKDGTVIKSGQIFEATIDEIPSAFLDIIKPLTPIDNDLKSNTSRTTDNFSDWLKEIIEKEPATVKETKRYYKKSVIPQYKKMFSSDIDYICEKLKKEGLIKSQLNEIYINKVHKNPKIREDLQKIKEELEATNKSVQLL